MKLYKPSEHSETANVAPLVQFFELVHIGDTIQSMVQVYFEKELVSLCLILFVSSCILFSSFLPMVTFPLSLPFTPSLPSSLCSFIHFIYTGTPHRQNRLSQRRRP